MAQPITWQNVNQGDASTAWRAMDSAQRSINGAFDSLQGQITKSEDIQAKNDVAIKNNNSQDYLNKLYSQFKSPEDLAAGLTDGRVDQLKAAYGNAINHDQVRGAAEALLKGRQEQVTAGQAFSNSNTDFKQQGTVDSIMSKINSGDPLQVAAGKAEFDAHPELRNKAVIAQAANGAGYQLVTRDREGKKFTEEMLTSQANRDAVVKNADSSRISANASAQSAAAATSNAKTARDSLTATLQEHANEMVLKASAGLGTLTSHLANSPEGKAEINKTIASIKDDDARAAAARIAGKLPADAKAGDVSNLLQTIIKPGFWGTLGMKNTPDADVIKSFEDVYNAGKKSDSQNAESLRTRKALYMSLAAQGTDASVAYGNKLNASLGVPNLPLTPLTVGPKPVTTVPNPVAPVVPTPIAAQEAALRAAIPAPGGPPRVDSVVLPSGVPGNDPTKIGAYPSFSRAIQANLAAEVAKAKQAELDAATAKEAKLKEELKKYKKLRPYGVND